MNRKVSSFHQKSCYSSQKKIYTFNCNFFCRSSSYRKLSPGKRLTFSLRIKEVQLKIVTCYSRHVTQRKHLLSKQLPLKQRVKYSLKKRVTCASEDLLLRVVVLFVSATVECMPGTVGLWGLLLNGKNNRAFTASKWSLLAVSAFICSSNRLFSCPSWCKQFRREATETTIEFVKAKIIFYYFGEQSMHNAYNEIYHQIIIMKSTSKFISSGQS